MLNYDFSSLFFCTRKVFSFQTNIFDSSMQSVPSTWCKRMRLKSEIKELLLSNVLVLWRTSELSGTQMRSYNNHVYACFVIHKNIVDVPETSVKTTVSQPFSSNSCNWFQNLLQLQVGLDERFDCSTIHRESIHCSTLNRECLLVLSKLSIN